MKNHRFWISSLVTIAILALLVGCTSQREQVKNKFKEMYSLSQKEQAGTPLTEAESQRLETLNQEIIAVNKDFSREEQFKIIEEVQKEITNQ